MTITIKLAMNENKYIKQLFVGCKTPCNGIFCTKNTASCTEGTLIRVSEYLSNYGDIFLCQNVNDLLFYLHNENQPSFTTQCSKSKLKIDFQDMHEENRNIHLDFLFDCLHLSNSDIDIKKIDHAYCSRIINLRGEEEIFMMQNILKALLLSYSVTSKPFLGLLIMRVFSLFEDLDFMDSAMCKTICTVFVNTHILWSDELYLSANRSDFKRECINTYSFTVKDYVHTVDSFMRLLEGIKDANIRSNEILEDVLGTFSILYLINERMSIFPYKKFYLPSLCRKQNFKEEFRLFKSDCKSILEYIFILPLEIKAEFIKYENSDLMKTNLQDSFFRSLFEGPRKPYLFITVARSTVYSDTLKLLSTAEDVDLKKQVKITFNGEEGVDSGGIRKEYFQLLSEEILSEEILNPKDDLNDEEIIQSKITINPKEEINPKKAISPKGEILFNEAIYSKGEINKNDINKNKTQVNSRLFVVKNESLWINSENSSFERYEMVGKIIGIALYNDVILNIPFPRLFFKKLLERELEMVDLVEIEPEIYTSLVGMRRMDEKDLVEADISFCMSDEGNESLETRKSYYQEEIINGNKSDENLQTCKNNYQENNDNSNGNNHKKSNFQGTSINRSNENIEDKMGNNEGSNINKNIYQECNYQKSNDSINNFQQNNINRRRGTISNQITNNYRILSKAMNDRRNTMENTDLENKENVHNTSKTNSYKTKFKEANTGEASSIKNNLKIDSNKNESKNNQSNKRIRRETKNTRSVALNFKSRDVLKSKTVDKDNIEDFIKNYADKIMNRSIEKQFEAIKKGFYSIVAKKSIGFLQPKELEKILVGSNFIDVEALKKYSTLNGYSYDAEIVNYFWEIFENYDCDNRKKLLQFITGNNRTPIGSAENLRFVIMKNGCDTDRLPSSQTCFNTLLLPEYSSKEKLEEKLYKAITMTKGFYLL